MFTQREFADGAHAFRQKVFGSQALDSAYEEARADNELAVLELSTVSDPVELALILSYLETLLLDDAFLPNPTPYKDCVRFSILFTYYKKIAQTCSIARTRLDKIYSKPILNFDWSTGGLIYVLEPQETDTGLPRIRAKIPISHTLGRIRATIHEAFVAFVALNPLRALIPSFSYVYALWHCGNFIDAPDVTDSGLCATPGTRPVIIYESNPNAGSLHKRLTQGKSTITTSHVINYLLQITGALELAHSYADYTHYDLHSGNVLVQTLDREIKIAFQDYQITTDERIIIIDNGLAHCAYSSPLGKKQLNNTNALEFVNSNLEAEDRLISTRIFNYGSIQNKLIGVRHDRSYPLGDVFRIFFDIYNLCPGKIQAELKPLVRHFFKDEYKGEKDRADYESYSMLNSFSLPPFREEFYNYRYAHFASEILRHFPVRNTIQRREIRVPRGVRMSEDSGVNFRIKNPEFYPTYYEVGIYSQLDEHGIRILLKDNPFIRDDVIETEEFIFSDVAKMQLYLLALIKKLSIKSTLKVSDDIFSVEFMDAYQINVAQCVSVVQWVRKIYSNSLLIAHAQHVLYSSGEGDNSLSAMLNIEDSDLFSLGNYCRRIPLPPVFQPMKVLTQEIENNLGRKTAPDDINFINWYKACLPAIKNYINFCLNWSSAASVFGELSLPDSPKPQWQHS